MGGVGGSGRLVEGGRVVRVGWGVGASWVVKVG